MPTFSNNGFYCCGGFLRTQNFGNFGCSEVLGMQCMD